MERKKIAEQILSLKEITELNRMQRRMLETDATSILLHAPTGSGKTLAFVAAMLAKMGSPDGSVQAVVIAPSRELVLQIYEVTRSVARGYKVTALYGGHSALEESKSLSVTPDIVVATPGRLLDHINRGNIDLGHCRVLVLDEYDKSLELGFADEMRRICNKVRMPQRTILTSATSLDELPPYLRLDRPTIIEGERPKPATKADVYISYVESPSRDKLNTLIDLLNSLDDGLTIVFVNHRESAERVHQALTKAGLPAGLYHGALEQADRAAALTMLENATTPILVTTDLASRGIDIPDVANIIHYHLPPSEQSWIHRNGRTGRMGSGGHIYIITSEADSIPDYVAWDSDYNPTGHSDNPIKQRTATLYFAAGKKDKISRGDIVGFLIANAGLSAQEIGKIAVGDHSALAAVPAETIEQTLKSLGDKKIKGKRVRVSQLLPGSMVNRRTNAQKIQREKLPKNMPQNRQKKC